MEINPVGPTLDFNTDLTVMYSVSGWSFTSVTGIEGTGWTTQDFSVTGSLGAFTIGSDLVFDPMVPEFTSWTVTGGLSLAGVTFDGTFTLVPGITSFEIEASGSAGNVDVYADLMLGGIDCNLGFSYLIIDVSFPFCCAEVSSEIKFDCQSGFKYVTFGVSDIAITDWIYVDALLTFDILTGKTLKLTPGVDFGGTACFDLYFAEAGDAVVYPGGDPLAFGGFAISGIGLNCEIGGVKFEGISYWGETGAPKWLNGYWEAYRISTTDDGCCGPFTFDIAVFFDEDGLLFDLAALEANMSIDISTQFTFGMGLELDLITPSTLWTLSFTVVW